MTNSRWCASEKTGVILRVMLKLNYPGPLSSSFFYNDQNGSHRKRLEIFICTNFIGKYAHQYMAHTLTVVRLFIQITTERYLKHRDSSISDIHIQRLRI